MRIPIGVVAFQYPKVIFKPQPLIVE